MKQQGNILLTLTVAILLGSGVMLLLMQTYNHQEIFRFRKKRESCNQDCRNILVSDMHRKKRILKFMPADILKTIAAKPKGVRTLRQENGYTVDSFTEGVCVPFESFEILFAYEHIKVRDMKNRSYTEGGLLIKGVRGRIPVYLLPFVFGGNMPPGELDKLISVILKLTGWGELLPFMKTPYVSLIINVKNKLC